MNILYDLIATQPNGSSLFHGGGEYGKIVFDQLIKYNKNSKIVCIYDKERNLDNKIMNIVKTHQIELISVTSNKELQGLIDSGRFSKFYSALPYRYFDVNFRNIQFIYTIHGLRSIELPTDKYELFYEKGIKNKLKFVYKNLFKENYKNSKKEQFSKIIHVKAKNKKIIVPSNHTKYALLNNFPDVSPTEIEVLFSPRKEITINKENELSDFGVVKSNYFLLISGDRWLKSGIRAVKALDALFTKFPEIKQNVLILGVENENIYNKSIKNREKFIFCSYVEEEQLEQLYRDAYCFIYPTLNEGFGYPPLECLKYGTPVICSSATSIPEVCKDGVIYFNPYSIEEIQNRVLFILFEEGAWKAYSEAGHYVSQQVAKKQDDMLEDLIKYILV